MERENKHHGGYTFRKKGYTNRRESYEALREIRDAELEREILELAYRGVQSGSSGQIQNGWIGFRVTTFSETGI
jgi:hypothetical protein